MAHSTYDEYRDIPKDLIPAQADLGSMMYIVLDVKEAIQIRHDFQTAVAIAGKASGIRRLPGAISLVWESNFANTFRPDAKTMAGLAAEHKRLTANALSFAGQVTGNVKLGKLLRENLRSLFPILDSASFPESRCCGCCGGEGRACCRSSTRWGSRTMRG